VVFYKKLKGMEKLYRDDAKDFNKIIEAEFKKALKEFTIESQ
jgi:hypothetical protein